MKKVMMLMLVAIVAISFSGCDACKENVLDKAGDWVAGLGKEGREKDQAVAERKADRAANCLEQKSEELAKSAEKTGDELKKKLGL